MPVDQRRQPQPLLRPVRESIVPELVHPSAKQKAIFFLPRFLVLVIVMCVLLPALVMVHFTSRYRNSWAARKTKDTSYFDDVYGQFECERSTLEDSIVSQKYEYGCSEIEDMYLNYSGEKLGSGFWREVYMYKYKGKVVAVKRIKDSQKLTERNRERHRWEAVALEAVKGHPNIVGLLGVCGCDMVTDYVPYTLDDLFFQRGLEAPPGMVIAMALDAARGLAALHDAEGGPIVHADLQPRQLMLSEDGVVRVNDLNRCRFMGRDAAGQACPFRIKKSNGVWRSPEEYGGKDLTEKLDIYSMGLIFWSMLARTPPFEKDHDQVYKRRVVEGERPWTDKSWHKGYVELFQEMWRHNPKERPSAREVVHRLEAIIEELPGDAFTFPENGSEEEDSRETV
ncbi:unnamed protein product [Discosporangium mesarthrocarpum]